MNGSESHINMKNIGEYKKVTKVTNGPFQVSENEKAFVTLVMKTSMET